MRILAIVSRDLEKGSTKYRLAQYLDYLSAQGATVEFVRRDALDYTVTEKARNADLLFNQKCLVRQGMARRLVAASRRIVFDFDDAIYTRPGKPFSRLTQYRVNQRLHLWLRNATLVTPANAYLESFAKRYSANVKVVPMALDLEDWRPIHRQSSEVVTIGWAGAPVNIHLLERLEPVLAKVLSRFPQARLAVFSGQRPRLSIPFSYQPFEPGSESAFTASLDIGLLPLINEEFSRGKSPIKSLQYLACGVPVVGNVFGATAEILRPENSLDVSDGEGWLVALERLITSSELRNSLGMAGRSFVEQKHNVRKIEEHFWTLIAQPSIGCESPANHAS